MELTQQTVKELFDYHEDGYLIWKVKKGKTKMKIGDRAGHFSGRHQRYFVGINFKAYRVARIIFLWHKGYLPINVDHKDGNSLNDKISNLRAATPSQNNMNRQANRNSTSKYIGVHRSVTKNRWCAHIRFKGKSKNLGSFSDEIEAAKVRDKAAKELFGEFARLNFP